MASPSKPLRLRREEEADVEEVDVSYRVRATGQSKVTGSLKTSLRAGMIMIVLLIGLRFRKLPN